MVISAFNSLTLSPALAAILLRPRGKHRDPLTWIFDLALGWFFKLFNVTFNASTNLYTRLVGYLLRISLITLLIYGGLLGLTYWQFSHAPTGFIPQQDKGYVLLNVQLPDSASVERTQKVMAHIEKIAHEIQGVSHTVSISGQSLILSANAPNLGSMYVMLKDFHDRRGSNQTADDVAAALGDRCRADVREAVVSTFGATAYRRPGHDGRIQIHRRGPGQPGAGHLAASERRDCGPGQ